MSLSDKEKNGLRSNNNYNNNTKHTCKNKDRVANDSNNNNIKMGRKSKQLADKTTGHKNLGMVNVSENQSDFEKEKGRARKSETIANNFSNNSNSRLNKCKTMVKKQMSKDERNRQSERKRGKSTESTQKKICDLFKDARIQREIDNFVGSKKLYDKLINILSDPKFSELELMAKKELKELESRELRIGIKLSVINSLSGLPEQELKKCQFDNAFEIYRQIIDTAGEENHVELLKLKLSARQEIDYVEHLTFMHGINLRHNMPMDCKCGTIKKRNTTDWFDTNNNINSNNNSCTMGVNWNTRLTSGMTKKETNGNGVKRGREW